MRSRSLRLLVVLLAASLCATAAWAFWTTSGSGSASGSAGTLDPAAISVPSTSTGSHTVTWTQQAGVTGSTDESEIAYTVERRLGSGIYEEITSAGCGGPLPHGTTSCTDTVGANGSYSYRVVARFRSWTATSGDAGPVEVTVDGDASPTATSITRSGSSPTNAASVDFTVTFSESVTGVDSTDFVAAATGVTDASVTSVSGSGDTYTVTVDTGTGSGALGLNLDDDDSIEDSAGHPLVGASDANGDFTGESYAIDKGTPTVLSIDRVTSTPTKVATVQWLVTFSEDVAGVSAADLALVTSGVSGASITSVTGSGSTRTVTAGTGSGDGTIRLDLVDDNSIQDPAGNPLGGPAAGDGNFTGQAYTIDKTAPDVTGTRLDPTPTNLQSVRYRLTFTEDVTGLNVAENLSLDPTLSGASITGLSGSGSVYDVTLDTGTGDGPLGLDLDWNDSDRRIEDAAGNNLRNALSGLISFASYTLDRTAPTVVSISRASASPTDAASVQWTVTYSEAVTGITAADYDLAASGVTGASITGVSGSGATRTVTASTGSGSGTMGLAALDDDTITDTAGNGLTAGLAEDAAWRYTVDKPSVLSIDRLSAEDPTNDTSVSWTVTFSEPVSGVDSADFTRVQGGSVTGSSTTSVTPTGSAPTATWTVVANTGAGSGSLGLNLTDNDSITDVDGRKLGGAGTTNGNFTGQVFTIDKTAPALQTLQMFDDDANGLIDRADATFNETLETSGANVTTGWTSSNRPGGVTLNAVSVSGSTASVAFTGGAVSSSSTSVGSFTITLSSSTGQIRDALGNKSGFSNQAPTDKAGPVPFDYLDSDTSGSDDGKLQTGDTLTISFTEALGSYSTAAGAVLRGGTGSANDDVSLPGTLGNAFTSLSRSDYITGDGTQATFSGATAARLGTNASDRTKVLISLGASCSTTTICGTNVTTPSVAGNYTYTPSTAIVDQATSPNAAAGSYTESARLF